MEPTPARAATTAYDIVGGAAIVRQIVERFYDLLEQDENYAALRRLHAPDLAPMRRSLADFLAAWLGGPKDWFENNPGKCMMSAHRDVAISSETAQQWSSAMTQAIGDCVDDPHFGAKLAEALSTLAMRMSPA